MILARPIVVLSAEGMFNTTNYQMGLDWLGKYLSSRNVRDFLLYHQFVCNYCYFMHLIIFYSGSATAETKS